MNLQETIEHDLITKYRTALWSPFMRAVSDYELVKEGDKVAVCISGGKDSFLLAKCMQELAKHGKFPIQLEFIVMDPGYKKENRQLILSNAEKLGIPIHIFDSNIFETVNEITKKPCYLCARMRRGYLYRFARELGCNKIALGHHFDDVIETILMSMLFGGEFKTMMPKLHSAHFEGMELIRPLYYVHEKDIITWKNAYHLNFLNCACKFTDLVEKEEKSSKRLVTKQLIASLKEQNPFVENNIFKSVEKVNLNTLISYHKGDQMTHFLDHYDDE
ncbi:MAG TPA: tRNA 2-thiocytidine biosynthesis protein TtcA [Candidatus Faecenecus gallistercoris]|jgi:tRNA 2-thiocytidine biosynthesis protein TtcA|uniref:tRNA 2-thiocytidine biosynthesis protein TtcA n=1 Tax=Candidatus Faecenecus gallistercoris TaxID=2840793 RepID=A0A9D0YYH4_9FIRM|nr:predicted ATPase of the PP-loop superfamily implicated in cell cycle control [Bacillus sp. CAG:988]HIQ64424.1 tRNA 2-thiocytidine biosynthesis protein TtcA [Candidatus Faecenecus gallistercoris]